MITITLFYVIQMGGGELGGVVRGGSGELGGMGAGAALLTGCRQPGPVRRGAHTQVR